MANTKRVFVNGQWAVLAKDPSDTVLWKVSQEDGTTALATRVGVNAMGPAILKISAMLLKGPARREFLGVPWTRKVSPQGLITWEEVVDRPELDRTTVEFYSDRLVMMGPAVAQFNDTLDSFWRSA